MDDTLDFIASLGKMMDSARDGAEQGRDRAEAEAEAQGMSPIRLQAAIQKMAQDIEEKNLLLQQCQENLQKLPVRELLGETGAAWKDKAADLMAEIDSLRIRLQVFQKHLQSQ